MPSGFQNNFRYGERIRSFGRNSVGTTWDMSGLPLIGYDAVYTYRSGKRSKMLSQAGNYQSLVRSGSLGDQIRRRTEFLNQQIRDELEPTTGSTKVFSNTDNGHPFATFKMTATEPYVTMSLPTGSTRFTAVVQPTPWLPIPDFSNPFGFGFSEGNVQRRYTYFSWPSTGGYLLPTAPSLPNQVVSNAVKNNVAAGLIASSNPWKPKANLAQDALELLMLDIPTFTRNLERYLLSLSSLKKTIGNDWLNVSFGWLPLAQDLRATIEFFMKLHMVLYAYDEDARRKRGGDLGSWARTTETGPQGLGQVGFGSPLAPSTYSSTYMKDTSGGVPLLAPANIPSSDGKWSRSYRVSADFRFAARFHRGARPNSQERGYLEKATELLGLDVTPAVLWEITPWTWLLDWGSNLGAVAANISQLDWSNVLLDFAYLTFCVKTEGAITWSGPSVLSNGVTMSHNYMTTGYTTRELVREQASPYGFSVSWDGLSPFQLSILAALGMSRGR